MQNQRVGKIVQKRSYRPLNVTFSWGKVSKFALECAALFLFASVDKMGIALALSLFAGLVYARQNLLLLAPVFMLSCVVFSLSAWTVLYTAVPIIFLFALYAVCFKLRRNVQIYFMVFVVLLSMVPYAVVNCLAVGNILEVVVALVLTVVLSFCCSIVSYAVLFRKINCHFTLDEQICGGIILAMFAYCLCGVSIFGFCAYFLVFGFLVILCSDCFAPSTTLFCALLMGLGGALYFGSISVLGSAIAVCGIAVALSSFPRFASATGMLAVESLLWFLNAYPSSGWKTLVLLAVGVVAYCLLPKSVRGRIAKISKAKNKDAIGSLVNRNRSELATKLFSVGDVFYDMSKSLDKVANVEDAYTGAKLAQEIAKNYCGRCQDRDMCEGQLGGSTASVLEPMANAALARGRVTILDMPPFVTSRCTKMHNLVSVVNSSGEAYSKRKSEANGIESSKQMMSEQFAGVSLILDSLARDCGEQVTFSEEINESIQNEMLRHNIVANEIVVSGSGNGCKVTLTVRAIDSDKAVLPRIVSNKMKARFEIVAVYARGDMRVVHLESAPTFEIAYGIAEKIRGGEGVSGDSKSLLCPSRHRRLFAISDGMGSGENASRSSQSTISMVESFYRAGFDNALILSLINKLLKLNADDCFSSLDIAVIDTVSGGLDVIKLGAAESFVVHRDSIEMLSSSCPPAGILDKLSPVTTRLQLFDGDMFVMMSDGVFDALDSKGVIDTIDTLATHNPQSLADALLAQALEHGAEDDCTVMVLRLLCA